MYMALIAIGHDAKCNIGMVCDDAIDTEVEELVAEYLRRWPESRRLADAPEVEAITIVGLLLTAVHQGSRAWHELDNAASADFADCCRKALNDIFLLKDGSNK